MSEVQNILTPFCSEEEMEKLHKVYLAKCKKMAEDDIVQKVIRIFASNSLEVKHTVFEHDYIEIEFEFRTTLLKAATLVSDCEKVLSDMRVIFLSGEEFGMVESPSSKESLYVINVSQKE